MYTQMKSIHKYNIFPNADLLCIWFVDVATFSKKKKQNLKTVTFQWVRPTSTLSKSARQNEQQQQQLL